MEKLNISPFFISSKFSFAKAENVVKAPRKPISKRGSYISSYLGPIRLSRIPNKKQPRIFTEIMPNGKKRNWDFSISSEIITRERAPVAPPMRIRKYFIF